MSGQRFEHRLCAEPQAPGRLARRAWSAPCTFGLDEDMVWMAGGAVEAKVAWPLLNDWQVQDDWLILGIAGLPRLYYPLSQLRKRGLYQGVMDRLKTVTPRR